MTVDRQRTRVIRVSGVSLYNYLMDTYNVIIYWIIF